MTGQQFVSHDSKLRQVSTYEEGPGTNAGVTQGVEGRKVQRNVLYLACRAEKLSNPERLDDLLGEKVSSDKVGPASESE